LLLLKAAATLDLFPRTVLIKLPKPLKFGHIILDLANRELSQELIKQQLPRKRSRLALPGSTQWTAHKKIDDRPCLPSGFGGPCLGGGSPRHDAPSFEFPCAGKAER
jgi:hypothetical protein